MCHKRKLLRNYFSNFLLLLTQRTEFLWKICTPFTRFSGMWVYFLFSKKKKSNNNVELSQLISMRDRNTLHL